MQRRASLGSLTTSPSALPPDRSVFFCVHKAVEHELPEAGELPFAKAAKAHWGAVDGSNEYADCDVAVIFGLPFRDRATFPTNVFFALKGVQGDEWLDNPTWKGQVNLREHMVRRRQLSASVIQAINRIRCRHVTDDRGGCPPADVFIVLPSGDRGDDILAAIRREMPGFRSRIGPLSLMARRFAGERGDASRALVDLHGQPGSGTYLDDGGCP